MTDDQACICPACGEHKLTEFDPTLLRWHCGVCSETWRRPPGRLVPSAAAQPQLPGLASMTLETELPPAGLRRACEICRRRPAAHEDRDRPAMVCRGCSKRHGVPLH